MYKIKRNKMNKSNSSIKNIQEKGNLKKTMKIKQLSVKDTNNIIDNWETKNNNSPIIKTFHPQCIDHKKNKELTATKLKFERLLLQRQSYQHFLPYNSNFK